MPRSINVTLLIDFDNYFKKEIDSYSEGEIDFLLSRIISEVIQKTPDVEKITLRLYSGWYEEQHLSKKASVAMQLFSKINIFPIALKSKQKLIHGEVEFASELLQIPSFKWYHTFKERFGIPHLRINHDCISSTCEESKDICPVQILSNFTKSKSKFCKVPGCKTQQMDVFFSREQKMVDTLIACDIISLFEDPDIASIFLVSDDMDHLPSLAFGKFKNNSLKDVYLCISNKKIEPLINSIISNFDIKIVILS